MAEHPIQGLMKTAMENLKEMIDVNTIIGDPVETPDGSVILTVSRVGFGFAAGGSEFGGNKPAEAKAGDGERERKEAKLPFGGGSGGGVSITPIAFLIVGTSGVKILHLDENTHVIDKILESAPQTIERIQQVFKKNDKQKQQTNHQNNTPF
ncbi:GerW family sporulation protein [Bacillus swezeyi]|uniref:Sporulation protein YtfJ n=1 Tax=Bacillus swezeyi TaxID=1925020 RepID=A0A5M8RM79_9BACI|nr:GerW family sporulation protein [Bacillus swezeyi]KAA6448608.1 sporulation protein YtfJ [Bacillus swezeyi]KAA6481716.1 sporulation protein YtfJ [Bacillus swezeyi]TYS34920.1 sporulation protein YtfJ [Bacillus swezeyi]